MQNGKASKRGKAPQNGAHTSSLRFGRRDLFFASLPERLRDSFFLSGFGKIREKLAGGRLHPFRALRRAATKELEQSLLLRSLRQMGRELLRCPLWTVGLLLLSTGLWSIVGEMLKNALGGEGTWSGILFGAGLLLSSLPLLLRGRAGLGEGILSSCFLRFLLFDLLGLYEDLFRPTEKKEGGGFTAFLLGSFLGIAVCLASPWKLCCGVLLLVFGIFTLLMPEAGLAILLGLLPFAGRTALTLWLLFVWSSYLLKLLRGKRSFRFGMFGALLTVYGIFVFWGTLFPQSAGARPAEGFHRLLVLSGAVLAMNLVRDGKCARRLLKTLSLSVLLSSLLGLGDYFLQGAEQLRSGNGFPFSRALMTASFAAPEEYAGFLAMVAALLLAFAASGRIDGRKKFLLAALFLPAAFCLLFTWNLAGLLCALLGVVLFLWMRKKYGLLGLLAVACLFFGCLLPTGIFREFSLGSKFFAGFADRTALTLAYLQTAGACLLTGAGSGASAPAWPAALRAPATLWERQSAPSLHLQILCENGVFGLLFFLLALGVLLLYCGYVRKRQSGIAHAAADEETSVALLCGFSAAVGALLFGGLFLNFWQSAGGELCFWLLYGITAGLAGSLDGGAFEGRPNSFELLLVYQRKKRK